MRIGTLKETYVADAALFDSRTQKTWLAVAAALLVLFPFVASDYWLYLACLVSINVASATGLNILTGYTGLVSLGQAAFMGLGAYTVAILQAKVGSPFLLNILAGGVVAMVGGIIVGVPSLRVKGLYLAIATIAASFIAHFLFANLQFTGGTGGLSVPPVNFRLANRKCAMNEAAMVAMARYSPFTRSEGTPTTMPPTMATTPPARMLSRKGEPTLACRMATV